MRHVLLAENNKLNQIAAGTLHKLGWDVTAGLDGVEACRHNTFDAVLMDRPS